MKNLSQTIIIYLIISTSFFGVAPCEGKNAEPDVLEHMDGLHQKKKPPGAYDWLSTHP